MPYISRCHYRHSSPTLWRKLMNIGLRPNPIQPQLSISCDMVLCVCDGFFQSLHLDDVEESSIDCGDCEDLFLAIAALNDSTDIHQWFVCNNGIEEVWFMCNQDDVSDCMPNADKYCHKATQSELIYYFTTEY